MDDLKDIEYQLLHQKSTFEFNLFKIFPNFEADNIQEFLPRDLSCYTKNRSEELLCNGVRLIEMYLQLNYTGPSDLSLPSSIKEFLAQISKGSSSEIILDGEEMYTHVEYPVLLLIAERLLEAVEEDFKSAKWWRMRALFLHQRILEERSTELWSKIQKGIQFDVLWEFDRESEHIELNILYYLELVPIYLHYYDISNAKKNFEKARELSSMSIESKGIIGKRTKFQEKSLPQLVVRFKIEASTPPREDNELTKEFLESGQPYPVLINDEVLLENVKLDDEEGSESIGECSATQLAVIFMKFYLMTCTEANDGELFQSECRAYCDTLLKTPKSWAIQFATLLARSKYERGKTKTFERAMKQFEELNGAIENSKPSPKARNLLFFAANLPRIPELNLNLAQVLESLNLFKSALDIYLSLKVWESCITCYMAIEQNMKARELIANELRKNGNSVKFWILLGDLISQMKPNSTFDDEFPADPIECYNKAWELSGEKSAKAMRQLGNYHFARKEYKTAVEFLERSVALNPLDNPTRMRLGYACIQTENWSLAAKSYLHVTTLDNDNFQAWNNLAKAELHMGDLQNKKRAYIYLKEAIKCNYESWEVWDNYLGTSLELRDFSESISAYQKIVQLKGGKFQDEKILLVLSQAVCLNIEDVRGDKSLVKYRKPLLTLLAQVMNIPPQSSKICRAYADVLVASHYLMEDGKLSGEVKFEPLDCQTWDKSLSSLQKALARLFVDANWSKVSSKIEETLDCLFAFCNRIVLFQSLFPNEQQPYNYISVGITNCDKVIATFQQIMKNAVNPEIYSKFIQDTEKHLTDLSNIKRPDLAEC